MTPTLERIVFAHRGLILAALAIFTALTGVFAVRLRLDTDFEKHLPVGHEYIDTFLEYQEELLGTNRLLVVLRAEQGDIWNPEYLRKLSEATDALAFLPGIDRRTVTSLWTPNVINIEITEDGMRSEDVIGADVTPESISQADVERIRDRVIRGGYVGQLVSKDFSSAMIVAEVLEVDTRTQQEVDVLALAERLETEVRERLRSEDYDVHILGFVKMIGDIAQGARSVVIFFILAFLLTTLSVYAYSRSWILTVLPLGCSLASVVWQFGVIELLGFGLDPLAILVPFLVFAIGVSHGIQQINLIAKRLSTGDDSMAAARASFRGLLLPGSMALVTDLIAFGTLVLMPIPMIQELGITATVGVAFKIISNLVLLPVLASYFRFDPGFVGRFASSEELSTRLMKRVGRIAERRTAFFAFLLFAVLFATAVWQSQGRHIGDLHPGATELRPDARYNRDADLIVDRFGIGLDLLTVVAETPEESCVDYGVMEHLDRFSWHMSNVPGVLSVLSAPVVAKVIGAAWNEGNLKWRALPRNQYALMQATSSIPAQLGLFDLHCTVMPIQIFTTDHRAETIKGVVAAVHAFRDAHPRPDVRLRLGSGNIGVQAAVNEELEQAELPMMLYVYATIVALVILTYRDWRATVCCSVPLVMATFFGYWFMKQLEIGLKVATLPVMVLAVGIGVNYAFYIYNRLQHHLENDTEFTTSFRQTLFETGNAVVFTAVTLAVGVSTWAFSPLKFQADMGLLLTFMFLVNMAMAVTALPALAVVLDVFVPRRRRRSGEELAHREGARP